MSVPNVYIPGKTTVTVSINDPEKKNNPINNYFFNYKDFSYNTSGNFSGIMSQNDCENKCFNDSNCNNYSLYFPNNPQDINYNNKYGCYISSVKFGDKNYNSSFKTKNNQQGRGSFDKNIISDKEIYRKGQNVPDDYELLPNTTNTNLNIFNTICRSSNQQENNNISKFAISKGYKTAKECSQECNNNNSSCTGFDLARPRNDKYDCYIFTIPKDNITGQVSDGNAYGCFKKITQVSPGEPEFSYNYNNKILDITFTNKNNITKYRITLSCSSAPDSYYILDMDQTKSNKTNIKIDIDNVLVNKIGIPPQDIYLQIESIYNNIKSTPKKISFKYSNIPEKAIPIQEDGSQRIRPRPSQKK